MVKPGLESYLSDLRVLVLNHCVYFSEKRLHLGIKKKLLDSQMGSHVLEFLRMVDFSKSQTLRISPIQCFWLVRPWDGGARGPCRPDDSVLSCLFAGDLELPKPRRNVFLICPVHDADIFSPCNSDLNNTSFCVVTHLKSSIIKNPSPELSNYGVQWRGRGTE